MTRQARRLIAPSPDTRGRTAFSLVELVIALLIMAILAAAAGPRISDSLSRYRADAAAQRVAADIGYAQRDAQTSSQARSVIFDTASHSYTVTGVDDLDHRGTSYTVSLTEEPYRSQVLSADFGGSASMQFDGYGTVSAGGSVVVGSGSSQKTVSIDPDTGRARIE